MISYNIYSAWKSIKVYNNDDSLYFLVKKTRSILGKYTLYYFISEELFLILEKYDYLLFSKKKLIYNNLNYTIIFQEDVMSFEGKEIKYKTLDFLGSKRAVYLNGRKVAVINVVSRLKDDQHSIFFDEMSEDVFLILVSYCSMINYDLQ
ncbi:hypothetical protein [Apibacter adventoris]|uniref:Uncharacterized protein n=1 Tax=Apibacter adventoris TaxID=1679466 RepID=A0A2S8AEM2_9FLAO|nr:hypothetical protein [Apibacter adventoris]PQL93965.1 hypothetical protein C4S77_04215 [Apibacter adventoris]